jgi:hypothetical protein
MRVSQEKVLGYLMEHPSREFKAVELAKAVGIGKSSANSALANIKKHETLGRLMVVNKALYSIPQKNLESVKSYLTGTSATTKRKYTKHASPSNITPKDIIQCLIKGTLKIYDDKMVTPLLEAFAKEPLRKLYMVRDETGTTVEFETDIQN